MKKALLLILLALSSVWTTYAQTNTEIYELFDVSLEDLLNVGIVSASKKKQSVKDAPATAYVFTGQQIETRGYQTLLDVLNDVPEVEIQHNSNPEFRNIVSIRGVTGNEKFLILYNGIRITPATGDGYTFGTQFALENVERVEVIIGPASALYGVDAFSGIINIISKNAESNFEKAVYISPSYGNYGTTNNSFLAATKLDRMKVSLAGNYYSSMEADYSKTYTDEFKWYNEKYKTDGIVLESPFFRNIINTDDFQRSSGSSFNGDALSREYKMPTESYYLNGELTFEDMSMGVSHMSESHQSGQGVDPRFSTRDGQATIRNHSTVFYIRHLYKSFNEKWNVQSTIRHNFFETDPRSHYASAESRWQRGYIYSFAKGTKIQEQFQYEFNRRTSFTGGLSFENLSALPRTALTPKPIDENEPLELQDIYYIGAAGFVPYLGETQTATFNDSLALSQKFFTLNYQNYGAFGQFQLKPLKFLELTLGSRFDYNTRYGNSVNPRMGLVLSPNKKMRIKFLYGESFLAPSPTKAFTQSGAFYFNTSSNNIEADFFHVANPDLGPEKLRSAESSFNWFVTPNLTFAASAFYTQIDNLIDLFGNADPSLSPEGINVLSLETSVNQGSSTIKGGTVQLNYLFKLNTLSINPYGSFSVIDGDIDGNPLLYTANMTAKGGIEFRHRKFSFSTRFIYRNGSYTSLTDGENGPNKKNDPFIVLSGNAVYNAIEKKDLKLSVFVRGTNLLNSKYYNVFFGNEEGMARTPQDPLRISGGVRFTFL